MSAGFTHERRIIKPVGVTAPQLDALRAGLEREVQQQTALAADSGSAWILRLDPRLEVREDCFIIRHEPASREGWPVGGSLLDPRVLDPVLELVYALSRGLEAIHSRSTVHGTLSPGCLLQVGSGWKITDVGVGRAFQDASLDFKQLAVRSGAPDDGPSVTAVWEWVPATKSHPGRVACYVDPQVWQEGLDVLRPRSDLYALAVILYGLMAGGRHPFLQGDLQMAGRARYSLWKTAYLNAYTSIEEAVSEAELRNTIQAFRQHKRDLNNNEKRLIGLVEMLNGLLDSRDGLGSARDFSEVIQQIDPDLRARLERNVVDYERAQRDQQLGAAVEERIEVVAAILGSIESPGLDQKVFQELTQATIAAERALEELRERADHLQGLSAPCRERLKHLERETHRARKAVDERVHCNEQFAKLLEQAQAALARFESEADSDGLKELDAAEQHVGTVQSNPLVVAENARFAQELSLRIAQHRDELAMGDRLLEEMRKALDARDEASVRSLYTAILQLVHVRSDVRLEAQRAQTILGIEQGLVAVSQWPSYHKLLAREDLTESDLAGLEQRARQLAQALDRQDSIAEGALSGSTVGRARELVLNIQRHAAARRVCAVKLADIETCLNQADPSDADLARVRVDAQAIVDDPCCSLKAEVDAQGAIDRAAAVEKVRRIARGALANGMRALSSSAALAGRAALEAVGEVETWARQVQALESQGLTDEQVRICESLLQGAAEERSRVLKIVQQELSGAQEELRAGNWRKARAVAAEHVVFPEPLLAQQANAILSGADSAEAEHKVRLRDLLARAAILHQQDKPAEALQIAEAVHSELPAEDTFKQEAIALIAQIKREQQRLAEHVSDALKIWKATLASIRDGECRQALALFEQCGSLLCTHAADARTHDLLRDDARRDLAEAAEAAPILAAELPEVCRAEEMASAQDLINAAGLYKSLLSRAGQFDSAPAQPQSGYDRIWTILREYAERRIGEVEAQQQLMMRDSVERFLDVFAACDGSVSSGSMELLRPALAESPPFVREQLHDFQTWLERCPPDDPHVRPSEGFPTGYRIAGRYEVREFIERNSAGLVYRVTDLEHQRISRLVVITLRSSSKQVAERLLTEAAFLTAAAGKNLAPLINVSVSGGMALFEYEDIAGQDISQLAAARQALSQPLTPTQIAELLAPIADALELAHSSRLAHGDVRPGVIWTSEEPSCGPRLLDLGLARLRAIGDLQHNELLTGTPGWVAPEVITSLGQRVDHRADVYSLGCVLYSLLTGKPPELGGEELAGGSRSPVRAMAGVFAGRQIVPLEQVVPNADPHLAEVCRTAIALHPDDRYASAGAFALALREFVVDHHHRRAVSLTKQAAQCLVPVQGQALPDQAAITKAVALANEAIMLIGEATSREKASKQVPDPKRSRLLQADQAQARDVRAKAADLQTRIASAHQKATATLAEARSILDDGAVSYGLLGKAIVLTGAICREPAVAEFHEEATRLHVQARSRRQRLFVKAAGIPSAVLAVVFAVAIGAWFWTSRPYTVRVSDPISGMTYRLDEGPWQDLRDAQIKHNPGMKVTLAAPFEHQDGEFQGWIKDGNAAGASETREITVEASCTVRAGYRPKLKHFTIDVSSEGPSPEARVDVGSCPALQLPLLTCNPGAKLTLIALEGTNEEFLGWQRDGELLAGATNRSITIENTCRLVAKYKPVPPSGADIEIVPEPLGEAAIELRFSRPVKPTESASKSVVLVMDSKILRGEIGGLKAETESGYSDSWKARVSGLRGRGPLEVVVPANTWVDQRGRANLESRRSLEVDNVPLPPTLLTMTPSEVNPRQQAVELTFRARPADLESCQMLVELDSDGEWIQIGNSVEPAANQDGAVKVRLGCEDVPARVTDGEHELRVRLIDGLDNSASTQEKHKLRVDRRPLMTCVTPQMPIPPGILKVEQLVLPIVVEVLSWPGDAPTSVSWSRNGASGVCSPQPGQPSRYTGSAALVQGQNTIVLQARSTKGESEPIKFTCELVDSSPVAVRIEPSLSPTNTMPVRFTATFNRPVVGFSEASVVLSGTATPQRMMIKEPPPGSGTTYQLEVDSLASDGTVIVTIPAGAVKDAQGRVNKDAGVSTVVYDATAPRLLTTLPAPGNVADLPESIRIDVSEGIHGLKAEDLHAGGKPAGRLVSSTQPDGTVQYVFDGFDLPANEERIPVALRPDAADPAGNKLPSAQWMYTKPVSQRRKLEVELIALFEAAGVRMLDGGARVLDQDANQAGELLLKIAAAKSDQVPGGAAIGLDSRLETLQSRLEKQTSPFTEPVPNRFIEYFCGEHDDLYAVVCSRQGLPQKLYHLGNIGEVASGWSPADEEHGLGNTALRPILQQEGFFQPESDGFGIAVAPDGPLCRIPMHLVGFDEIAINMGLLRVGDKTASVIPVNKPITRLADIGWDGKTPNCVRFGFCMLQSLYPGAQKQLTGPGMVADSWKNVDGAQWLNQKNTFDSLVMVLREDRKAQLSSALKELEQKISIRAPGSHSPSFGYARLLEPCVVLWPTPP